MMGNQQLNPKGCYDYSPKIKTEKQSRRDDISLLPLRGFGASGAFFFYNLFIPSGFKMQWI